VLGLGRPGGLGFEPRTRRRRGAGWWGRPEVEREGEKGRRRAHAVGGGGGEGIVRLDFGAREADGQWLWPRGRPARRLVPPLTVTACSAHPLY